MAIRIEITTKTSDTRAIARQKKFQELIKKSLTCQIIDIYTVDKKISQQELETIAQRLANPLTQTYAIKTEKTKTQTPFPFDYAIEVGFLPGVTDNVATTPKEIFQDLLKVAFE